MKSIGVQRFEVWLHCLAAPPLVVFPCIVEGGIAQGIAQGDGIGLTNTQCGELRRYIGRWGEDDFYRIVARATRGGLFGFEVYELWR